MGPGLLVAATGVGAAEPVAIILAYGVLGALFVPFLAVTLLWLLNTDRVPTSGATAGGTTWALGWSLCSSSFWASTSSTTRSAANVGQVPECPSTPRASPATCQRTREPRQQRAAGA